RLVPPKASNAKSDGMAGQRAGVSWWVTNWCSACKAASRFSIPATSAAAISLSCIRRSCSSFSLSASTFFTTSIQSFKRPNSCTRQWRSEMET
ncbi:hypothetical protein HaLaN_32847, partial [Haematococcus lacustris]